MNVKQLSPLELEVFSEMAFCNFGTSVEKLAQCYNQNQFRYYAGRDGIPLSDISPLARLDNLILFEIERCEIADLAPISGLTQLKKIKITENKVPILSCDFTRLKNLESISVLSSQFALPKLQGLDNLNRMFLVDCGLSDLSNLLGLTSLKWLTVNKNPNIYDISPLLGCAELEQLMAYMTGITDVSPLRNLKKLKLVTLSETKVTDVSPLADILSLENINLYGSPVEDVNCLASLPRLSQMDLRKTLVTDISAFKGREDFICIERSKLDGKKKKSSAEVNALIEEIRKTLCKLGITPEPALKLENIKEFEERNHIKLPKEYSAFLTKVGNGISVRFDGFTYKLLPLEQVEYEPECIAKRFPLKEEWIWEDDDNASDKRIFSASNNGQLTLMNCGCGESFQLIVCGNCKGEVWDLTDVGMSPYRSGADFLDWVSDFLSGKFF